LWPRLKKRVDLANYQIELAKESVLLVGMMMMIGWAELWTTSEA